jgi:thiol-disulfide isomerase/thioredoxin
MLKLFSAVLIIIFFISGCSNDDRAKTEENNLKKDYVYTNSIEVIDLNRLEEIISNRNGRILFINVWATWCAPCVEEFPDLVRLDKNYSGENVDFISLSVDLPDEIESGIRPFLNAQKAEFPVYVINEKDAEKFIEYLSNEWSGAIPASFIYDESGVQQKFIEGARTYDVFAGEIDKVKNL